jgi:serine/threonine protein kinase
MAGKNEGLQPLSPGTNSCPTCGSVNLGSNEACSFCETAIPRYTASLAPGDRIDGKYEILSLLGVGGMGEVYRARHVTLDSVRCVKVMRASLMDDENFRARFLREARVATRVHHPNVAVIHDFDTTREGTCYLVSEFIDGITVRQWSRRHGRFPVDLCAYLILQVLSGLSQIHAKGLLHRDVSGDNIMLTLDHDDCPVAKIIDLGIAKVVEGSADGTQATQVGTFIGNPKYSSPEQLGLLGEDEALDARSDLYSLGIVIYEMVVGMAPFTSRTPQGYVAKHLMHKPQSFADAAGDLEVPAGFEELVFKALEKRREDRYRTAREFAKALRPYLGSVDPVVYGEEMLADLPSHQTEELLREVTPLPGTVVRPGAQKAEDSTVAARTEVDPAALDEEAWRSACEEDSRFSYEHYVLLYPSGRHAEEALVSIEQMRKLEEIRIMREDLDREGLRRITRDRSNSLELRGAAKQMLNAVEKTIDSMNAAWRVASAIGTVTELEKFIENHPLFERIGQATDLLEQARLHERATATDEERLWREYLDRWPEGRFADRARGALDTLEERNVFDLAKSAPSTKAFRHYLRAYPAGRFREEARKCLEESLSWDQVGWNRSDLEKFLSIYPGGVYADEARARIEALNAR